MSKSRQLTLGDIASDTVFVVDNHVDQVRARRRKAVQRDTAHDPWHREVKFFSTHKEALGFLVSRAEQRVKEAADNLRREEKRLLKCRRSQAKVCS